MNSILKRLFSKKGRYIYILHDGYFRYKIGISFDVEKRVEEIRSSMNGYRISKRFALRLQNAQLLETWLHLFYRPLRQPHKRGSGKTEWFFFIFPFTPIIQILLFWILEFVFKHIILIGVVVGILYLLNRF